MNDEEKLIRAGETYDTLCQVLDEGDWQYEKDPDNLTIFCSAKGEDLPIGITMVIQAHAQLLTLYSALPIVIIQEKRVNFAIAVSAVNNLITAGCFTYDITSGRLVFRMTNSFYDVTMGEAAIVSMIASSCAMIDQFNDKFDMLAKSVISLEQFMYYITKGD